MRYYRVGKVTEIKVVDGFTCNVTMVFCKKEIEKYRGKMKNYMCHKCNTLLQKNSSPNSSGCPGGGYHQWTDLGETGTDNYQCKKCGNLVQSKRSPSSSHCPDGGSHSWTKL